MIPRSIIKSVLKIPLGSKLLSNVTCEMEDELEIWKYFFFSEIKLRRSAFE